MPAVEASARQTQRYVASGSSFPGYEAKSYDVHWLSAQDCVTGYCLPSRGLIDPYVFSHLLQFIALKLRLAPCMTLVCISYVPRPREKGLVQYTPTAHVQNYQYVKLSVYYSLPRDSLTSSSNKCLGKRLRCPLPVNHLNELFALASCAC